MSEEFFADTPELVGATILALTSGKYDWLSGRCAYRSQLIALESDVLPHTSFVDANRDLAEVEQFKEQILKKDALVLKLALL